MNINYPNVSFIIPTLNAGHILGKCLEAIRNQKYPKNKIEIIISDGGSSDNTLKIAKRYKARIIKNKEVLHEPGKTLASKIAKGKLLFYTDADNILVSRNWLNFMTKPYIENPNIMGFLPQTLPPPDSSSLNRYLGYLFTDPFTWFVYENGANPKDYDKVYKPLKSTAYYKIYKFSISNLPLFGLSQGVGTSSTFKRDQIGKSDDLLAGIKLIKEGGLIAYIPKAGVYHYHVVNLKDFSRKYRWRVKNNYVQKIKGMGFKNREIYFSKKRILRKYLFVIYGLTLIFPFFDSIMLYKKYKDYVMFWHLITSPLLAFIILYESIIYLLFKNTNVGTYG